MSLSRSSQIKGLMHIKLNLWVIEDVPDGELEVFNDFSNIFGSKINFFGTIPLNDIFL